MNKAGTWRELLRINYKKVSGEINGIRYCHCPCGLCCIWRGLKLRLLAPKNPLAHFETPSVGYLTYLTMFLFCHALSLFMYILPC